MAENKDISCLDDEQGKTLTNTDVHEGKDGSQPRDSSTITQGKGKGKEIVTDTQKSILLFGKEINISHMEKGIDIKDEQVAPVHKVEEDQREGNESNEEKSMIFKKEITKSDIQRRLALSQSYVIDNSSFSALKESAPSKDDMLQLLDHENRTWKMKLYRYGGKQPDPQTDEYFLSRGWKEFVMKHEIQVGDEVEIHKPLTKKQHYRIRFQKKNQAGNETVTSSSSTTH